jgi:SAM-dependent methyltransferase
VLLEQGARGLVSWGRCPACRCYFSLAPYDLGVEVSHTETTSWGQQTSGVALNAFKRRMFLSVLELLERRRAPPATILDVGCSYGGFLLNARRSGYDGFGIDIVPAAIRHVRSAGIPAAVARSIADPDVAPRLPFDIITCLDCNYYWPNQPAELRHAFEALRPGGLLAMRVVDKSWMLTIGLTTMKLDVALGARIARAAVNDHRFSMPVTSLLRLLERTGFEVLHASPEGALHSDDSRWPVKASFALGRLVRMAGGPFVAPGALVLARKPAEIPR